MATTYTQVVASGNKPEVFRAYMAENHGSTFTYGGSGAAFTKAVRMAKLAARVMGMTFDDIVNCAKEDFAVIDA